MLHRGFIGAYLLWLVGVVCGDRFLVTQWLSWIPPAVVVAFACVGIAMASWARRQHWQRMAFVHVLFGALAFMNVQRDLWHPFGHLRPLPEAAVGILQWNTNWPSGDDDRSLAALAKVPADIVLISNRGSITSAESTRVWAGDLAHVYTNGPFAFVTTFPVIESRLVAMGGQGGLRMFVACYSVLIPQWNGKLLRIAMVDLPSRPTLERRLVAGALRRAMDRGELGPVDVVAGDFNVIDGSVILSECFPMFHDASTEAGIGWLATWPRKFPLWKIDHVMLSPGFEAVATGTIDPGVSDHHMTWAIIQPREAVETDDSN